MLPLLGLALLPQITSHSEGLWGYMSFDADLREKAKIYSAGIGFYTAVWPLAEEPLAGFQIGLPGTWILPDNSDNKDRPLAPEGTLARKWKERGPTWSTVFQTIEGGIGLWAGNHFRYGYPKFSMNGTPQCYDYEIGSPGWSFFYSNKALPDNRLGIAQLTNRLLIPPDGLPFAGKPNGEFLGYSWLALPFTDAEAGDTPSGDQSWTCFLNAENYRGPIAFYIPETWSKIGKLFNDPYLYGRGLDARAGTMGGGAIEINTVPRFDAKDVKGTTYSKIPRLQFPVDDLGRSFLVQGVSYFSRSAMADAFKTWREGGKPAASAFDEAGTFRPNLTTRPTSYKQAGKALDGVQPLVSTKVFGGNIWGLQWNSADKTGRGTFPQYYRDNGGKREAVPESQVPAETGLLSQKFRLAEHGVPYETPKSLAWTKPGPKSGPFTVRLVDGSKVTYAWYRFIDQPSFQQYAWSPEKRAKLQSFVEKIHKAWTLDKRYMAPPTMGKLVGLDSALLVKPPKGMEVGYVPIVIGQE